MKILERALNVFICDKLIAEGYFYVRDCIDNFHIADINKILKIKMPNSKGEETDLSLYNSIETLEIIFDKIATEMNKDIAQSIVSLYLNQNNSDYKHGFPKDDYASKVYDLCCKYGLIDKFAYRCENGFILSNELKIKEIDSISKYIDVVTALKPENLASRELFFRGHPNINYQAVPSVFRGSHLSREYFMYQELVVRCQEYFVNCQSHFDFISLMQHYGLPTRLLDITYNPLVALYFACENQKGTGEVLIYRLEKTKIKYERSDTVTILSCLPMFTFEEQKDIYNNLGRLSEQESVEIYERFMHEIKIEKPAFLPRIRKDSFIEPVFVIPSRKNKRIMNQKGAFILFGLEEYFLLRNNSSEKSSLSRYKEPTILFIPQKAKEQIIKDLRLLGIDRSFIYPEIDDVAEDIKNME